MTTTTYILVLLALFIIYCVFAVIIIKLDKQGGSVATQIKDDGQKDDGQIVKASASTFNLKEVDGHE